MLSETRPSRGHLPVDFVTNTSLSPAEYIEQLQEQEHAGYNLVIADFASTPKTTASYDNNNSQTTKQEQPNIIYYSNRNAVNKPRLLSPGLHGLTNGSMDEPWPKIRHGKELFQQLIDSGKFNDGNTIPWEEIFEIMTTEAGLVDNETELPKTGWGAEFEKLASPIFVKLFDIGGGMMFGTRSQTVLVVKKDGMSELQERYLDNNEWKEQVVHFRMKVSEYE